MKFRPSFRQRLRDNAKALDALAAASGRPHPQSLEAQLVNARKPPRQRASAGTSGRVLEAPIQSACIDLLSKHPKVALWRRFNGGGVYTDSGAYVAFSNKPVVDLYALLKDGRTCWFEVKAHDWTAPRTPREHQQAEFLDVVRSAGCIGMFVTDPEQVAAILR